MYILQVKKNVFAQTLCLVALIPYHLTWNSPRTSPNRCHQPHVADEEMWHTDLWPEHPQQVTEPQDICSFNHKEKPGNSNTAMPPHSVQSNAGTQTAGLYVLFGKRASGTCVSSLATWTALQPGLKGWNPSSFRDYTGGLLKSQSNSAMPWNIYASRKPVYKANACGRSLAV